MKTHVFAVTFLFLLFSGIISVSQAAPKFTTYQAKIIRADNSDLETNGVNFRFTILNPNADCILYVENYSNVDMRDTNGYATFKLGSGTQSHISNSKTDMFEIFNNNISSYNCGAGSSAGSYTPGLSDSRKLVMQFQDGSLGWQTVPALDINSVPFANYATLATSAVSATYATSATVANMALSANTLSGFSANDFVASGSVVSSQWAASGTQISYQAGHVAIGTTTPTATLSVSGSLSLSFKSTVSVSYTLTLADAVVTASAASGSITLTLPSATSAFGRQHTIKKTDTTSNTIVVSTVSSQTIDASSTYRLYLPNQYITVMSDGSNWNIINASSSLTVCPDGMMLIGQGREAYCIEKASRAAANYVTSTNTCKNLGYNLCSWHQWYSACSAGGLFTYNSGTNEWVGAPYSSASGGRMVLVGNGGCGNSDNTSGFQNNPFPYRCCVQ